MDYYASHKKTTANSIDLATNLEENPHFPDEGICIGTLNSHNIKIPALIFLQKTNCLGFLYDSDESRGESNRCMERLAWRIAFCLKPDSYQLLLYNGGKPGECFDSLNILNKTLFYGNNQVMFDGLSDDFTQTLQTLYLSTSDRASLLSLAGKDTLIEHNNASKFISSKYIFVFISDVPNNLTEIQKHLISKILQIPSKLGIFFFYSVFIGKKFSQNEELNKTFLEALNDSQFLIHQKEHWHFHGFKEDTHLNKWNLKLLSDVVALPDVKKWAYLINGRVQGDENSTFDLRNSIISYENIWNKTARLGLEIPIGITGTGDPMYLRLGHEPTLVHGLIGGATGSGKSVLLHDIIIHASWLYPPEELQFVLLDFKGVEFGIYDDLPNVRILSTSIDREFGANALSYINAEITKRETLFKKVKANDIAEYNDISHHVPRILVIIDEFQKLFEEDRDISQNINHKLTNKIRAAINNILNQGRAFGIHLLLSTQNPNNIPDVSSSFSEQMKLRIGLLMQCKGGVLDFSNDADPSKFHIGEGVYNINFGKSGTNVFSKHLSMEQVQRKNIEMLSPKKW